MAVPASIWLSCKGNLTRVRIKDLEFVGDLANVARQQFPRFFA
jgi:hypothetical protein